MNRLVHLLVLLGVLTLAGPVRAQQDASPAQVDTTTGLLSVDVAYYLEDGGLRRALHSGLPVRMEVRVELWKDGFFDSQVDGATWRASVLHDAVSRSYEVVIGDGEPESLGSMEAVATTLQQGFQAGVELREEGRYYYLAQVELETLSLSDLEELGRWLQGDLGPAVSGERSPESAVGRGLRRIMVRALGLPARRERLRTPTFSWSPPVEGPPRPLDP